MTTSQKRVFGFFLVATIALFLISFELGRMDVWSDNEGQRAAPPQEMLQTGDLLIPTLNGDVYLAKPPLLYWLIAAVYKTTGVINAFTARIPTALFALALVVGVYIALRRNTGEGPARWAAVALVSSYYFLDRSRNAEIDVPMAACLFGAIWSYRAACLSPAFATAAIRIVAAGVLLGGALMFKGPAALPFVWAAWAAHCLTVTPPSRRLGIRLIQASAILLVIALPLAGIKFPIALIAALALWTIAVIATAPKAALGAFARLAIVLLIAIALTAPWAIAVVNRMGWDYITALLDNQVLERTHTASLINSGSPFFYLYMAPVLLAPWGLLLPIHASRHFWKKSDGTYRFALAQGWLSVLIFSLIAGKESEYILPAFAFLLIPTGYHLAAFEAGATTGWRKRWIKAWGIAMTILLVALAIAGPVYAFREFPSLTLRIEVTILALATLAAFAAMFNRPDRRLTILSFMWFPLLAAIFAARGFDYQDDRSFQHTAQIAGRLKDAGYTVNTDRLYPAFTFYAGQNIPVEKNPRTIAQHIKGDAPYFIALSQEELTSLKRYLRDTPITEITQPATHKHLLLIGNRPIPDMLKQRIND